MNCIFIYLYKKCQYTILNIAFIREKMCFALYVILFKPLYIH